MDFEAIASVKRAPEPAKPDLGHIDVGKKVKRVSATETKPVTASMQTHARGQESEGEMRKPFEARDPSKMSIDSAISDANNRMTTTRCEYSYDEATKRVSIKVFDKESDELIREVPPEESLEMLQKMLEMVGLIVDEQR